MDILTSLAVAVLASCVSVFLAFRKFKSEKWWDKRLECYSAIAESLSRVIIYSDLVHDVELDHVNHDEVYFNKQKVIFNEAIITLQAHAHTSSIFLDDESTEVLQQFLKSLFRVELGSMDIDKLGNLREEAASCLEVISSKAKLSLGVGTYNSF